MIKESIKTATRLDGIGEYYFSTKLKEIDALNKAGKNIINLGIGSPDLPPHPDVIEELNKQSQRPDVHAYQNYKGSPILRQAISNWYAQWYNVELDPVSEILPLMGSKEGIMHICMTYLDKDDIVLIPNPGYPTYSSAVRLAGGQVAAYTLDESKNWAPDFAELDSIVLSANHPVKMLFVSYPHMPTGASSDRDIFEKLVRFAIKHDILIIHDNPYSFILNDSPMSMLEIHGAKEVVIELNSLSKSHNMAGWRVGMICAAEQRINEIIRFKSNMDSGMFLPVQLAAAKALELGKDWFDQLNEVYKERREKVYELLALLKCTFHTDQNGMFVWAKCPIDCKDGFQLSDDVLYNANVFITPGGIFGSAGCNYVRVSLCSTNEKLDEAIKRIKTADLW